MLRQRGVSNRRKHPRQALRCAVQCYPTAGRGAGRWWRGAAVDISCGGVRVQCAHGFEDKEVVKIRLGPGARDLVLIAQVVRVQARPDGGWELGCRFVPELCADELQEALAPVLTTEEAAESTAAGEQ